MNTEKLHTQLAQSKIDYKHAYTKLKPGESLKSLKPLTDKHAKIHAQIKKLK